MTKIEIDSALRSRAWSFLRNSSFELRHFKVRLLRFEHLNERLLRNVDFPDALHPFFSFFLFLKQLSFSGYIAAVAFRGDIFS